MPRPFLLRWPRLSPLALFLQLFCGFHPLSPSPGHRRSDIVSVPGRVLGMEGRTMISPPPRRRPGETESYIQVQQTIGRPATAI